MQTVRLYSQPMNPFTEKVVCALTLKRVPYLRVEVTDPDEIRTLSPETRLLPVLEAEGRRVDDSPRILAWLDELHPDPPLLHPDPKIRGQQQNLADWSDTSFAFYWNRWRAARDQAERERERQAAEGPGLLSRLHQSVGRTIGREADGAPRATPREAEILAEVSHRMDDLVGFLGTRDFFFADAPSVADLAVFGMLLIMHRGPMPGSADALAARPTLVAHLERMLALSDQPLPESPPERPEPARDRPTGS